MIILINIYVLSFRSKPLTLYVFSSDQEMQNLFMRQTSSGSFCVNDTVSHYAGNNLQKKFQHISLYFPNNNSLLTYRT